MLYCFQFSGMELELPNRLYGEGLEPQVKKINNVSSKPKSSITFFCNSSREDFNSKASNLPPFFLSTLKLQPEDTTNSQTPHEA